MDPDLTRCCAEQQAIDRQQVVRAAGLRDQERSIAERGSARADSAAEVLLREITKLS